MENNDLIEWLTCKQEETDNYDGLPDGPPRPIVTSWGMCGRRESPPPRKTKYWFMLDEAKKDGLTVCRAKTLEDAYCCMADLLKDGLRTVIRPVEVTEEMLQEDTKNLRTQRQFGTT